jgi:alpha-tubulin suppressor-like RCC1 family protein
LTRTDINYRDAFGRTLLHLAASSTSDTAFDFAPALLDHPLTDLYLQDTENGWTALHRAFYAGNISIAQAILARDSQDALSKGALHHSGGLIKIKDKEGNGPFDLLEMSLDDTVGLQPNALLGGSDRDDDSALGDSVNLDTGNATKIHSISHVNLDGDEVFTFGSNKNVTLGFGDEDDRQFPERVVLRRPEHLYHRFYREHLEARPSGTLGSSNADLSRSGIWSIAELPAVILNKPIRIQDTQMAKFHSAILTTDPESNLYICGHGSGGRIGIGDETTRYHFVCIEGGALAHKRVASIALGQNHTLALSTEGEIFSWGSNGYGQLGYALPKAPGKDEPIQTLPRQIFGPFKRETVIGIAASKLHSVAHTSSSLYTFGKNEGQIGIMDSDARSLEIQDIPRKVGASLFSVPIAAVSAIDRATTCLLENHEVWVFANYGYAKVPFPLEGFTNYFIKSSFLATDYDRSPNVVCKIVGGGDTICALSSHGETFTLAVSQPTAAVSNPIASTSNLSKIKGALSQPQRVWSNKKSHMAARDVDVDQNGSIILVTHAGSVWRRVKRAKIKDASALGTGEYKPKDYKFSRISGLTRVSAVRASGFGAYAAVREDCTKTRDGIDIFPRKLWTDIQRLMPFRLPDQTSQPLVGPSWLGEMTQFLLSSKDIDRDIDRIIQRDPQNGLPYDMVLRLPTSEVEIPIHAVILAARSKVIRHALEEVHNTREFSIPDLLTIEQIDNSSFVVKLQDIDTYALFDLVLYLHSELLINFTHFTPKDKRLNYRYKQARPELLKLAAKLELSFLESAVKRFPDVPHTLDREMDRAIQDPVFFDSGDIIVQLADDEVRVHGALICQRCPFFNGLFNGRAGGQWLTERRQEKSNDAVRVDLGHINASVFDKVLRHIYADTGPELFDDLVADNLDKFLDKVMEVLGVSNELMLDRLSEICQAIIGKYGEHRVLDSRTSC